MGCPTVKGGGGGGGSRCERAATAWDAWQLTPAAQPPAAGCCAFQPASEALGLTGRNSGALRGQALLHPIDGSDRGGVHVNTPFNREGWACMST